MPLPITIKGGELYDEVRNEFHTVKEQRLVLEHSLVSISKWEAKWHKPFLSTAEKTLEESIDYIRCMTLTQNVNPSVYNFLDQATIQQINEYINDPMTATKFYNNRNNGSRETVTNELIYYWMTALNIPMECQKWHLNRLMTLIRICSDKNAPPKKMGKSEFLQRRASLNAARRKAAHSRG